MLHIWRTDRFEWTVKINVKIEMPLTKLKNVRALKCLEDRGRIWEWTDRL